MAEYGGETLCSRCGSLREWAVVIDMIQEQLASGRPVRTAPSEVGSDVAADPFSAAL